MLTAPRSQSGRELPSLALTIGLAALAVAVLGFAGWQVALRLPQHYELDYGEGFVWSEVADLLAGRIYRPIAEYPHALLHYTPLYHVVAALLWKLGIDPLLGGRLISLAAGTALAGACGLLAALGLPGVAPHQSRAFAGVAAAVLIVAMPETVEWATLMRVDMLAVCLGTCGLLALRFAGRRRLWPVVAGAGFLLALLTKQNAIAPVIAGLGALAIVRPRSAVALTGVLGAIGIALVIGAELATGGEFLRHTILYNAARFDREQMIQLWIPLMTRLAVPLLVAMGFAAWKLRRIRATPAWRTDPTAWTVLALSIYLAVGLLLSFGIGKVGAGPNYMLPLLVPVAVLAAMALVEWPRRAPVLLAAIAAQLIAGLATYPFSSRAALAAHEAQDAELLTMLRTIDGPVLSEDMTLLMRAGRPVPWEFGSFTELTLLGVIDEAPLVKRLDDAWFDALIVYTWEPQRFSAAVRAAAQARYQRTATVGDFEVWRRKPK